MKNTSKILALVLIVMTLLMSLTAITASAAGETYTVAGEEGLCGEGWDTTYTANDMTYDEATGTYTKIFENVAAGTYQYKVVKNHAWGTGEYPTSGNYSVTVPAGGASVKVTWTPPSTLTATLIIDGQEEVPEVKSTTVYVKNDANWSKVYCYYWGGAGNNWPGTLMTLDSETGLYTIDIPSGNVNCIFNNGSGTQTADLATPTGDAVLFNNKTNAWSTLGGEAVAPKFIIAGSDSTDAASIFGTAWDITNEANLMTLDEETGVYTIVYDNVPAGSYKFKATRDNSWTSPIGDPNSGDKDNNYLLTVEGLSKVTISCKDGDTKLTVTVEALHEHAWSDATCTEPKKCECGETQGEALGHDMVTDAAKAATCTETGLTEGSHCSKCDGATTAQEVVPVIAHSYAEGVCSACGAADPDYVAPQPPVATNDYVINFSDWEEFAKGTYADGDVQKYNDIFTFIHGNDSRVDESVKTFSDEFTGDLRFGFGGKTKNVNGTPARALQITADGAYTLKLWWVAGGDGRTIVLTDAEGNTVDSVTDVTGSELYISEFDIPAAGVYYLTQPENNNYWYKVELVKASAPVDPPHVNTLVVGDTNKIVIDGDTLNDYYLPIEWVPFVADKTAHYSFVGNNAALVFIYNADGQLLCGGTGAANLDAGAYLICVGNGAVGEINVAVTQSSYKNTLVEGDANRIVVDGDTFNDYNLPIEWVKFTVNEKAHYAFVGNNSALVFIFNAEGTLLCGGTGAADLEAGEYLICVGNGAVGEINVAVTKTAIEGGDDVDPPVDNPTHDGAQVFVVGENKVVIDGCTLNLVQQAVEMVKFEVTEKAKYTFVSDINTYISTSSDPADLTGYLGGAFVEEGILEPGTYYICCGNSGAKGEFTVTVVKEALDENCEHEWIPANCGTPKTCSKCAETEGEPNPEVHVTFADTCLLCGKDVPSFKVGDNIVVYVPGAANLMANGDLYGKFEITEPGTYVITGGAAEMIKVYVWSIPTSGLEGGQLTVDTPYAVNIDVMTETGLANSFEITLSEAGVYWIGFAFDLRGEGHEGCEFGVNISLKEEEHVHVFEEGKCECGEEDPNYVAPSEPEPEKPVELNFFQKIVKFLKDLLAKFLGFFKRFGL